MQFFKNNWIVFLQHRRPPLKDRHHRSADASCLPPRSCILNNSNLVKREFIIPNTNVTVYPVIEVDKPTKKPPNPHCINYDCIIAHKSTNIILPCRFNPRADLMSFCAGLMVKRLWGIWCDVLPLKLDLAGPWSYCEVFDEDMFLLVVFTWVRQEVHDINLIMASMCGSSKSHPALSASSYYRSGPYPYQVSQILQLNKYI